MADSFAAPVERLIEYFNSLPGVGRKSAQRLVFHMLAQSDDFVAGFSKSLTDAKSLIFRCEICQNLTDTSVCPICSNDMRDRSIVCVVSDPKDVAAIEHTREYKGVYHVLHGVINPLASVGPDDIRIKELVARVAAGGVKEVIMATDPDTVGETTAMYICRLLRPFDVKVTRLAYGIPVGSHLEFADDITLTRAIEGRKEISEQK